MQGKVRVLIVDDAVVVRRMLADILDSDPELEVVGTAANGKAALEKMPQVEPQVVILDIDMPEMNGIETLIEIRKRDGTIPSSCSVPQLSAAQVQPLKPSLEVQPITSPSHQQCVERVQRWMRYGKSWFQRLRPWGSVGYGPQECAPDRQSQSRHRSSVHLLRQDPRWVEPYLPPDPETPRPRFGRRALPVSIVSRDWYVDRWTKCVGRALSEAACKLSYPDSDRSAHAAYLHKNPR